MNPEKLNVGDFGDDVARLHENLKARGFDVSPDEVKRKFFGPATRDAVRECQTYYGLGVTGEVDKATDAALSAIASDKPSTSISATVPPVLASSTETLLSEVRSNPGLSSAGRRAGGGAGKYRVDGRIASRISASVNRLRVVIVDKSVGDDVPLAETTTDSRGNYRVSFSDDALRRRGKEKPDLQVRVYSGEQFLAASTVRYDASTQEEELNVFLDEKASSVLRSEHETLTATLSTYYNGNLRDLQETDERQDITYLANKSGWDARAVALAALAEKFSAQTSAAANNALIEPAFFYALFRSGLPANEAALYRTSPKTVEGIWKQAFNQGIIPADLEPRFAMASKHFQQLAARNLLEGSPSTGLSSFKEILQLSLRDDVQKQQKAADLYIRHADDRPRFWEAVEGALGQATASRLRLDGQLAYLTLNNARLIQKVHGTAGGTGIGESSELVGQGFYRADRWKEVVGSDPVPPEIPGENVDEKRERYAELLAAQVRLSFPTAVVAQMVKSGETPTGSAEVRSRIHGFLSEHKGKFEIGVQPISQYVARHNLQVDSKVTEEITRIQRVYQITPSDEAMNGLLEKGIDSANAVARYEREEFVRAFKNDIGGEKNARLVYAKAQQVHTAVLNVALTFLAARNAPGIGIHSPASIVDPTPSPPANAADVLAYGTLESLFGEMDYCSCDHCRSILSPAAYLVDLLQFLYSDDDRWFSFAETWKTEHASTPYPFVDQASWTNFQNDWNAHNPGEPLPDTEISPFDVLTSRRPDIQHLPLTCENTNTPLPYIDLVNETLEYYITNGLSLADTNPDTNINTEYIGHSTDGSTKPEELLASPQFVSEAAYTALANEHFPSPLPFRQPLEYLRRYFRRFEAPLPEVMEALRKSDSLERASTTGYGWRDIWMETLGLSRAEHRLLTERWLAGGATDVMLTVKKLYGFDAAAPDADVRAVLDNAKSFSRRVGITYEELVEILRTRFVNPNSHLIPRIERLHVPFAALKALKDGAISDADFDALIANDLDPKHYGGDIKAWVKDNDNYSRIMGLVTLTNPADPEDVCSFNKVEFRYSDPDMGTNQLRPFEFVRLIRFIRLWKKLGWSIEQTDKAVSALYPVVQTPDDADDAVNLERLDAGFLALLSSLGVVLQVMNLLQFSSKKDLLPLLACFAPIDTHGELSLYRQMFLSPSRPDDAFAEDGHGNYLQRVKVEYSQAQPDLLPAIAAVAADISYDHSRGQLAYIGPLSTATRDALKNVAGTSAAFRDAVDALYSNGRMVAHSESLRAAFSLTASEFSEITAALGYDASTPLTLDNISAVFRSGWLARKLRLSVREFLLLTSFTGYEPFESPNPVNPAIVRLIEFVGRLRALGVKPVQALYLIWNQDLSGKSAPAEAEVTGIARMLRNAMSEIEGEFAIVDDPDGAIARERMALVYGNEATDLFFGLLENTLATEVEYNHGQATLEQAILDAAPDRITYDDFRKQLSYSGVLTTAARDALKALSGVTQAFKDAVDALYAENQKVVGPFFDRYPELLQLHDTYRGSSDPVEEKRTELLEAFLPQLKNRRKRQQSLQLLSAAAETDIGQASGLLEDAVVLHAAEDAGRPVLDDFTAMETAGLAAQYFYAATVAEDPDLTSDAEGNLDYTATGSSKLPPNAAAAGSAISGVWSGYLEAPENGFYKVRVDTDSTAAVALTLNGEAVSLLQNGGTWENTKSIKLRTGTLYVVSLKVENVKNNLSVSWQTAGHGWEIVPARHLYSSTLVSYLRQAYIRFLKATELAEALKLTPAEMVHFAAHTSYQVNGEGWMNLLSVTGSPDNATATALLKTFKGLLEFTGMKTDLSPGVDRLLEVLLDPESATADADSLLYGLTRWEEDSLDTLLVHFGKVASDLAHVETLRRVYDAYGWVRKLGIPAAALIDAATNEPSTAAVDSFQASLRARYDESVWLEVLRPINDEMRSMQRDALVAYILHRMRSNPASAHIDTPEKLFEYFLMDVQMDPCMLTSRIRHALSSVQLFIERSLMNLEPRVSPASINAKHWEWMKRYRVWEANRKVFIWPENWLEPELRDDQSPFFKETMSELLQGDITEDRAAEVLMGYLTKLEEVSKLEVCGVHYEEKGEGTDDDVVHVVARTAGANRKYFYRRREPSGWTPWEKVSLDIEDNPVLPVVWKNRLFLFWLKVVQETKQEPLPTSEAETLAVVNPRDAFPSKRPQLIVKVILNWSEFLEGKWQPTRTSDPANPLTLNKSNITDPHLFGFDTDSFDRSKLRFWAELLPRVSEPNGVLRVIVSYNGLGWSSFVLYNPFSTPELWEGDQEERSRPERCLDTTTARLEINFSGPYRSHTVLEKKLILIHRAVGPCHPLGGNSWDPPFFYEDSRHVFYVTASLSKVTVPVWEGIGIHDSMTKSSFEMAALVVGPDRVRSPTPPTWQPGFGVIDPSPIDRYITEDAYIKTAIGTPGTVSYGDKIIGPSGSQFAADRIR